MKEEKFFLFQVVHLLGKINWKRACAILNRLEQRSGVHENAFDCRRRFCMSQKPDDDDERMESDTKLKLISFHSHFAHIFTVFVENGEKKKVETTEIEVAAIKSP